eukprot:GHVO01016080.1.p1 GENE.GHVO01016080.1~~GHVO01016080.1.p1  ORF type:complete len:281 (+),score=55.18 GHVO01016080.1:77-844(+)
MDAAPPSPNAGGVIHSWYARVTQGPDKPRETRWRGGVYAKSESLMTLLSIVMETNRLPIFNNERLDDDGLPIMMAPPRSGDDAYDIIGITTIRYPSENYTSQQNTLQYRIIKEQCTLSHLLSSGATIIDPPKRIHEATGAGDLNFGHPVMVLHFSKKRGPHSFFLTLEFRSDVGIAWHVYRKDPRPLSKGIIWKELEETMTVQDLVTALRTQTDHKYDPGTYESETFVAGINIRCLYESPLANGGGRGCTNEPPK